MQLYMSSPDSELHVYISMYEATTCKIQHISKIVKLASYKYVHQNFARIFIQLGC